MNWLAHLFSRNRRYDDLALSIQEHLDERTHQPRKDSPMRPRRAGYIRMALG
jgi:hypothetical protein